MSESTIWKADVKYVPELGTEPEKITLTCKERHDSTIVFNVQGSSAVLSHTEGRITRENIHDAVEYVSELPLIQATESL